MILQACFELLDHFSRLLDGDFDPSKFVELISGKFFSKGESRSSQQHRQMMLS